MEIDEASPYHPVSLPRPVVIRTQDEEFWFSDGNVILLARDVKFRIYSGLLANRSPVFQDMFSLPQPAASSDSPCPTVEMTDSPEDLRHILRVFMPNKDHR